jgi:alkylation response protein AidB-like acyl-CoA dehydrogenase
MAALDRTKQIAEATGAIADAGFRDRLAGIELRVVAQAAHFEDAVRRREAGVLQPAETSVLKIVATQTLQAVSDLMIEAAEGHAADAGDHGLAAASMHFLQSRRATIFGGTREIHFGIVARRILGLR